MFRQPLADLLQVPNEKPRSVNIEIGRPKSNNTTRSLERNVIEPLASVPDMRNEMGLQSPVDDFEFVIGTLRNDVESAALGKTIGPNDGVAIPMREDARPDETIIAAEKNINGISAHLQIRKTNRMTHQRRSSMHE